MLGALAVQSDGTEFSVSTGFSDAERLNPPPVGSTITFRIFRVVHDPFPP
jgi:DNA ligase-1